MTIASPSSPAPKNTAGNPKRAMITSSVKDPVPGTIGDGPAPDQPDP